MPSAPRWLIADPNAGPGAPACAPVARTDDPRGLEPFLAHRTACGNLAGSLTYFDRSIYSPAHEPGLLRKNCPQSRCLGGEADEVCQPCTPYSRPCAVERRPAAARGMRQYRLQRRRKRWQGDDRATHSDGFHGRSRKRASGAELDGQLERDRLLRKALHDHGRTLHANCNSDRDHRYRYGPDQWHEILLRCFGVQLRRAKRELRGSERDACPATSGGAHGPQRNTRECASELDLDRKRLGEQLSPEALYDQRRRN